MNLKRSFVSLLTALSFIVLAVSGVVAFVLPFSIRIIGLHSLIGFVFVGLVALHVVNNFGHLSRYSKSRVLWVTLGITAVLTALFLWQPTPLKSVLGLSGNLGPALDRFEMSEDGLFYQYSPVPAYKMALTVRPGKSFDAGKPPHFAIWLENASFYHIKTLHEPGDGAKGRAALPYWDFKMRGWEKARRAAELADKEGADVTSGATRTSSFNPADYVLPPASGVPMPYRLLIEIDQPGDGQPSLVYAVEIDNADPRAFQLLELVGYPKREEDKDGKEVWDVYYVDEGFSSALELIDSALLTIDRAREGGK